MIKWKNCGRPVDASDLARVERAIGHPIPEQYRAFLLEHNGGRPSPNIVDINGAFFKNSDLCVVLGIDTPIESDDILWNLEVLEGSKEANVLPIGHDSGACPYYIVFAGDGVGEIWFLHRREDPQKMYFVAPDFNSFLAKIRDLTPEERAEIERDLAEMRQGS